ncbi:hypothetical protein CSOJ01_06308 [Colletotrichum sojae]|uniref:Uncharacterized protein n=1 Tax=Colletotrichum sojae TaxID=2175907 RepID=A0A8H6MW98_9PEZI|nr:hypothetical protein CSOJ01_06308 [Colletotrichum sojae]
MLPQGTIFVPAGEFVVQRPDRIPKRRADKGPVGNALQWIVISSTFLAACGLFLWGLAAALSGMSVHAASTTITDPIFPRTPLLLTDPVSPETPRLVTAVSEFYDTWTGHFFVIEFLLCLLTVTIIAVAWGPVARAMRNSERAARAFWFRIEQQLD